MAEETKTEEKKTEEKTAEKSEETKSEDKGTETPAPGSERWNQIYARMKAAEEKTANLEKAQADKDAKHLEDQGKFKELYESSKVKADMVDEVNAAVQVMYDLSVKGISEDQQSLIPDLPVHKKLAWVANAKAKGMLTDSDQKPDPSKTFNGKPVNAEGKWWLKIDSNDARFTSLTSEQYQEWKNHKRGGEAPPRAMGF